MKHALDSELNVKIEEFAWSGKNRIRARRGAAVKLAQLIDARHDAGAQRIFLVAHSHGGNVAVAASNVTKRPIDGLIALATPFISASPHKQSPEESFLYNSFVKILMFPLFLLTILPLVVLSSFAEKTKELVNYSTWPTSLQTSLDYVAMFIFLILLALSILLFFRLINRVRSSKLFTWHSDWQEYLIKQHLKIRCLVIRASGDEAHTALMIGQMLEFFQRMIYAAVSYLANAIFNRAWKKVYSFWFIVTIIWEFYPLLVFMGFINSPDLLELTRPAIDSFNPKDDNIRILLYFTLPAQFAFIVILMEYSLAALVILISAMGLALASTRFGLDLMLFSPSLDLSVEDGPIDCPFEGVFLSRNSVDNFRLGYRHGIYQIPETVDMAAQWINTSCGAPIMH